jgi:2-succinyl-5-enolpyruvyl-6-hydroxy-3-cyclohexene-1-carboxylate synthase
MAPTTDTYTLLRAFVDELARCGMRAACTSPGSRSTPLVLSLVREPRLRCYSHVDERCAGFFALGLAKASARPVAVACTSGTAAAELLPAVIEAHEARVPLLVLTADRPWELRENGAGQAIDQLKLYGEATKWFFEVGAHEAGAQRLRWMRTLACRAYWTTLEGRPGAVHLNFPLREPLVIDGEPPAEDSGRSDGRPIVRRPRASLAVEQEMSELHKLIAVARRGVVLAGRHERQPSLGPAAAAFAESLEWPLLADPMSGARRGSSAIAHYDALLREPSLGRALVPDLIVRVGDLPVSKPLRTWLASLPDVRQVALDPEGAWQDPSSVVSDSLPLEPVVTLERMAKAFAAWVTTDDDWLASWHSADERAAQAILGVLGDERISEPAIAAELGVLLPEEATLFVASSMPVRDIETFWPVRADPPRVLCNRGANGIDGTVSSAFGAAAAGEDPVVLLIGDVALAYDMGGLLAAKRLGLKLTIVLIDNDGGGIFDFLPVADTPLAGEADDDIYTRHIATPTGLDFAAAAALYGLAHQRVTSTSGLRDALERALAPDAGSTIVQVQSERKRNVELHRRVWDAVSAAVSPAS